MVNDPMDEVHLVPPKRQSLTICSTTSLNQQHNCDPEVRWCCFKNPMFVFNSKHSLGWPLAALIEMLHIGGRILPDVLSLERELKDAMQARQFSVERSSFHCSLWVPLQRLAAPIIVIFHDSPLINVRQFLVPKIGSQTLQKYLVVFLALWRKHRTVRAEEHFRQLSKGHSLARPTDLETPERNLGFAFFPDFLCEIFAGSLGRFAPLFTFRRIAHPPEPRVSPLI